MKYIQTLALCLLVWACTKQAQSPKPDEAKKEAREPVKPSEPKLAAAFSWPPNNQTELELVPDSQRTDKNFYVVLDGSGSMRERKCTENSSKSLVAIDALQRFIKEIPKNANLGLLIFDDLGISERVPLGKDNHPAFVAALQAMKVGGGTPLRSAISKGKDILERQALKQSGYGEYTMIIVTDGESERDENPASIVETLVKDTPIEIHTLGFCIGNEHSLNQPKRTSYKSADSLQELVSGLKDVLAESQTFQVQEFK